jgi:hypothetical protein
MTGFFYMGVVLWEYAAIGHSLWPTQKILHDYGRPEAEKVELLLLPDLG